MVDIPWGLLLSSFLLFEQLNHSKQKITFYINPFIERRRHGPNGKFFVRANGLKRLNGFGRCIVEAPVLPWTSFTSRSHPSDSEMFSFSFEGWRFCNWTSSFFGPSQFSSAFSSSNFWMVTWQRTQPYASAKKFSHFFNSIIRSKCCNIFVCARVAG